MPQYPPSRKGDVVDVYGTTYHRLGTPQAVDELIYQRLDHPAWNAGVVCDVEGRAD